MCRLATRTDTSATARASVACRKGSGPQWRSHCRLAALRRCAPGAPGTRPTLLARPMHMAALLPTLTRPTAGTMLPKRAKPRVKQLRASFLQGAWRCGRGLWEGIPSFHWLQRSGWNKHETVDSSCDPRQLQSLVSLVHTGAAPPLPLLLLQPLLPQGDSHDVCHAHRHRGVVGSWERMPTPVMPACPGRRSQSGGWQRRTALMESLPAPGDSRQTATTEAKRLATRRQVRTHCGAPVACMQSRTAHGKGGRWEGGGRVQRRHSEPLLAWC